MRGSRSLSEVRLSKLQGAFVVRYPLYFPLSRSQTTEDDGSSCQSWQSMQAAMSQVFTILHGPNSCSVKAPSVTY